MGESQGPKVSRQAGQESPAQNECGRAGKNCGGGQGTLEAGKGGREEFALNNRAIAQNGEEMISG